MSLLSYNSISVLNIVVHGERKWQKYLSVCILFCLLALGAVVRLIVILLLQLIDLSAA